MGIILPLLCCLPCDCWLQSKYHEEFEAGLKRITQNTIREHYSEIEQEINRRITETRAMAVLARNYGSAFPITQSRCIASSATFTATSATSAQ